MSLRFIKGAIGAGAKDELRPKEGDGQPGSGDRNAMQKEMVCVADYPQLALLTWQRLSPMIDAEDAFALYESNWRFVDDETLTAQERALIKHLTETYGKGVLNI